MAGKQSSFWETIRTELKSEDEEQLHQVAYSVLSHLKDRINPAEAKRMEAQVYRSIGISADDIGGMVRAGPKEPAAEHSSADRFVEEVRHDAHLQDHQAAEQATRAVFHGLRAALPQDEQDRIYPQLPSGLQDLWRE